MARLVFHDPNITVLQPKTLLVNLPKEMRPYRYKTRRTRRVEPGYDRPWPTPEEFLTGYVHGKRASALEERFAMALDFFGMTFIFQFEVDSAYSLPGEGKRIDFIIMTGGLGIPIEIGASFIHDSPSKKEEERARQAIINDILPLMGIQRLGDPLFEVEFDRPWSFEDAKDLVSKLFRGLF